MHLLQDTEALGRTSVTLFFTLVARKKDWAVRQTSLLMESSNLVPAFFSWRTRETERGRTDGLTVASNTGASTFSSFFVEAKY